MNSFMELVSKRVSCRAYRQDPVPREMLEKMLEAARLAPSACNRQPWRFTVVTDPVLRRKLAEDGVLPGIGLTWLADAPAILVLGVKKGLITHKVAPLISGVDYSMLDIGIAGEHAILQATELGLGTCWVGWINQRKTGQIVGWPPEIIAQAFISVGWPQAVPENRSPRLDAREISTWK